MAGSALRRLMAEYKRRKIIKTNILVMNLVEFHSNVFFYFYLELTLNPPEGIIAGPISEENFFEWEALIT